MPSRPGPPREPHKPLALAGTRAEIVELLRRTPRTANEIAAQLGLTHNAVRVHLAALRHHGLVRQAGMRRSASRPAAVYELLPSTEAFLSRAYIPFVAHLVRELGERTSTSELDDLMRAVGRRVAAEWPRAGGDLAQRVKAASAQLDELGGPNEVERADGGYVIRGYGCLLAEAIQGRPEVCRAMESFLAELTDSPVRECCTRGERPRCCFEIPPRAAGAH